MTGSELVRTVHRIAALATREERRDALAQVPEKFRALIRIQCEQAFKLASHWDGLIQDGLPWHKVPPGIQKMLFHLGLYEDPDAPRK